MTFPGKKNLLAWNHPKVDTSVGPMYTLGNRSKDTNPDFFGFTSKSLNTQFGGGNSGLYTCDNSGYGGSIGEGIGEYNQHEYCRQARSYYI